MDKQVLTSSQASEDVSRYSVGILREGMYVYILCWFYSIWKKEQINWLRQKLKRGTKPLMLGIWIFFLEIGQGFSFKYDNYLVSYLDQGRQFISLSHCYCLCVVSMGSGKLFRQTACYKYWSKTSFSFSRPVNFSSQFWPEYCIFHNYWNNIQGIIYLLFLIIRRTSPHACTWYPSTQAKFWVSEQGWGKYASGLQPCRRRYIHNTSFSFIVTLLEDWNAWGLKFLFVS